MPNENHDKLNRLLGRQGSLAERSKLAQELDDDQLQKAAAAGIPQAKEELERRRHECLLAALAKTSGSQPGVSQGPYVSGGWREFIFTKWLSWSLISRITAAVGIVVVGLCWFVITQLPERVKTDLIYSLWKRGPLSNPAPLFQVSPTSPRALAPLQSRATDKSERKGNPPTTNEVSTPPRQKESRLSDAVFGDRWAAPRETPRPWGLAKEFAQTARINGFSGWHLPTTSEVKSLFESGDISSNSPIRTNCYWTADENGDHARVIEIVNGKIDKTIMREKNSLCSMILVREFR